MGERVHRQSRIDLTTVGSIAAASGMSSKCECPTKVEGIDPEMRVNNIQR
jgi:hypothetical protein